MAEMIIDGRFNGPAGSGNGGYTAGLVASHLTPPAGSTAEVTLRMPPPLDTPLRVTDTGAGLAVYADGALVAEAVPVRLDDQPVPAVPYQAAAAAAAQYDGLAAHPFPGCFVCGPQRAPGDGLRIFPGRLPAGAGTAAPWQVPEDVSVVTMWAALDCPGGWAVMGGTGTGAGADPARPYVLGRIAARVHALPPAGAQCVVVGAVAAAEGRKAFVRTAVYGPDGGLAARARATWLQLAS